MNHHTARGTLRNSILAALIAIGVADTAVACANGSPGSSPDRPQYVECVRPA